MRATRPKILYYSNIWTFAGTVTMFAVKWVSFFYPLQYKAFYNETALELCHNEQLISRLIYKDWKINIDSKRQLLDLEENLYQYQKDSEADPYFGKAYCFGIDNHWVWENMTGAGREWELKMEKFEKAFMIINFRDLILFNYQILNKELYEKYKH